MTRFLIEEAIDRAYAGASYEGRSLGAEVIADCVDGAPVFRAPNRAVARRLKRAGYRYSTWLCREPFGGGASVRRGLSTGYVAGIEGTGSPALDGGIVTGCS